MEDENLEDGKRPPEPPDAMFEKIKNTFLDQYDPIPEFRPGAILKSTSQIWHNFQRLYPNEIAYSQADITMFLEVNGFRFLDMGDMKYEWLLMPTDEDR